MTLVFFLCVLSNFLFIPPSLPHSRAHRAGGYQGQGGNRGGYQGGGGGGQQMGGYGGHGGYQQQQQGFPQPGGYQGQRGPGGGFGTFPPVLVLFWCCCFG